MVLGKKTRDVSGNTFRAGKNKTKQNSLEMNADSLWKFYLLTFWSSEFNSIWENDNIEEFLEPVWPGFPFSKMIYHLVGLPFLFIEVDFNLH